MQIRKSANFFITAILLFVASMVATGTWADGLPKNMIFFVAGTTCPDGSTAATDAAGRLLVVTTNVGDVGKTYGKPLTDQEERTHTHSGKMTVSLPHKHIAAATGGGNGQGTNKGDHTKDLTSGQASSALPFIQFLVCQVKN